MKRLVIILLALFLLIGGGGGAAYFYFLRPEAGQETPEQVAARLKAQADAKKIANRENPIFVEMPAALPAPLIVNGKVSAYLFLNVKFDLNDDNKQGNATRKEMEDSHFFALAEKLVVELSTHPIPLVAGTTTPDLMAAKHQIKTILEAEFGKGNINDVLIGMTYLQPF